MTRPLPVKRVLLVWVSASLLLAACAELPVPSEPTPARTPVPTWTLPFGPSDTPAPGETRAPEPTRAPEATGAPEIIGTVTPTARPGIDPTLGVLGPDPFVTAVTPVPEAMPRLDLPDSTYNILLLGRDTAKEAGTYRTDVMIVVSINRDSNSVTMLTLPRDLFVYIPGWTMNRLNTAAAHGDSIGYPGGGVALLEQTILYNFGIPIHGWARIDFDGFKRVVDILGGVEVPVSCPMQDWRLRDPALDPQNADNWELYTVNVGVQQMNGDMALWYARSRKRSSDFDRSRRQHQVLRAMFEKGLQLNALLRVPELYGQYVEIVDTNLGIGDVLQFVPMAAQIDPTRIKSRFIGREQVWSWTTPQGAAVLIPDRGAISALLAEAFLPPPTNTFARGGPGVEIWNGTRFDDYSVLAADNLAWSGITPVSGTSDRRDYAQTVIYDFNTSPKGSITTELQRIFRVDAANVIAQPDPNARAPYRVILGADYDPCLRPSTTIVRPTPTPLPGQATAGPSAPSDVALVERVGTVTPVVDGDLADWPGLMFSSNKIGFGGQSWNGAADASASWNLQWDDGTLFGAVRVVDDVFVQLASGDQLFRGDSLELWLSTGPGERTETLSGREYQIGLSPGDLAGGASGPHAYFYLPEQFQRPLSEARLASRRTENGYILEFAIPWSVFGSTPSIGRGFGFILALNDDDTPGSPEQESQVVSSAGARLGNPLTWNGAIVLEAATP